MRAATTTCPTSQATARSRTDSSSASARSARRAPAVATASETEASQSRSVRKYEPQRPAERTSASAMRATATRRPRPGIALDADALRHEPAGHFGAVALQRLRTGGLETEDENGLGVGGAEEPPSVGKGDPGAVDPVHGVAGGEVGGRPLHDAELLLVGAVHPDLRRGEGAGQIGEQPGEAERARAHDLGEARGGEESVVEAEPVAAEEDVAAHLPGERGLGLLHAGLDEGVAGLPHLGARPGPEQRL